MNGHSGKNGDQKLITINKKILFSLSEEKNGFNFRTYKAYCSIFFNFYFKTWFLICESKITFLVLNKSDPLPIVTLVKIILFCKTLLK